MLPAPAGMTQAAWRVTAVTLLMAIWWITEAIPIPATALLPIALYPVLGVMKSQDAAAPYANHLIYLFMGGFLLAVTMERWNLHRRIALHTIALVGTSPPRMILGFMVATGLLSMWVSNTATTMMMVPIGMAVIDQAEEESRQRQNFARCLMLGIAYAASIGGIATIIGTPPNTVMAGMVEKMFGVEIGFARWMLLGLPLAVLMLILCWLLLTRVLFPLKDVQLAGSADVLAQELTALGKISRQEKLVLVVAALAAFFWVSRGFLNKAPLVNEIWPNFAHVHDATIAIFCALLLFVIPTDFKRGEFLLDWQTAVKIPWGVMVLFGGGLAIAAGFAKTGLAVYVAGQFSSLSGASMVIFVGAVVLATVFLTELTSNTATATLLVPIMGSAAVAMGIHPFATIVSATLAASFAFMLPVATPPNAVVFGSGRVAIKDMAKAGFWLNLLGTVVITLFVSYAMPALWGIDLRVTPAWAKKG
ncbi:MAG: DASS family sodium-coupled anion symporter [Deltaproteobacteria bacterium]|nr:DASS family sodium-coupled anion symporter [Deltaproteobacteria bacterium]